MPLFSTCTNDTHISIDLFQVETSNFVHFKIITFKVMMVLHEYLLFVLLKEYSHLYMYIIECAVGT